MSTGANQPSSSSNQNSDDIPTAPSGRTSSANVTPPNPTAPSDNIPEGMRDLLTQTAKKLYPDIEPANDFEILQLSYGTYKPEMGDVHDWLKDQYDNVVELYGGGDIGKERLEQYVNQTMSMRPSEQIIGMKPRPGASDVVIRQIPGCDYCIRLWPGPVSMKHYYLDFVLSSDHAKPVNSPADFSLWTSIPSILTFPMGMMQVFSLEENMGVQRSEIRDGEERFVLTDGQECLLKRAGFRDVKFTVPSRGPSVSPFADSDFVDFGT